MKKLILSSFAVVALLVAILGCNPEKKADIPDLVGKWQRVETDTLSLVIEITPEGVWKYYQNGELLEKGQIEITADKLIMKHDVEEHSHENGDHHDHHHQHEHPEDHVYNYTLNDAKNELSIISERRTTVYKKIE